MKYLLPIIFACHSLYCSAQTVSDIQYQYTPKGELKTITENGITLRNYYDASGNRITTSQVAVEEIESDYSNLVKCYPNPTQAWVTVEVAVENDELIRLGVYSQAGQLLQSVHTTFSPSAPSSQIDFSGYAPGIYHIRVESASFRKSVKVIRF